MRARSPLLALVAAAPRCGGGSRRGAGAAAGLDARRPRSSTPTATAFLERGAGRAAARPRRPSAAARRDARHVRAAHRHARARRGVARARAVPGPPRRAVHLDLPPAGGVLHAGARRRGARAQPRAPAGRVRDRRHRRQRAGERARRWRSTTLNGGARRPRQRRARLRRRAGRRTPPTRSTTAPTTTRPRHPGRARPPRSARSRPPGCDAPWYPLRRQPRRARPGRGPADAGDRRVRHRRPARRRRSTRACARRATRPAPGGRRRACSPAASRGRTGTVPADPHRRLLTPGRGRAAARRRRRARARRADGLMDYTVDVGPRVRGDRARHRRPRRRRRRASSRPAQLAWLRGAARAAPADRWVVVFSHNPLDASDGGEAALRALDADPHVVAAISGNRHRTRSTRARPLLADRHLLARRLPAAGAHVPAARDGRRRRRARDLDGRPGRHAASPASSRELAYLDAQGGRPQHFAGRRADRNARLALPLP